VICKQGINKFDAFAMRVCIGFSMYLPCNLIRPTHLILSHGAFGNLDQYRLSDDYHKRFRNYESDELTYFENDDGEQYGVGGDNDGNFDYSFYKPDFNFKQFKSNLVIRWEYLPGSILYLVWWEGFDEWS